MPLQDVFLAPTGLAALAALVPLIVLYLVRPDPREVSLPTLQFLATDRDEGGSSPVLRRLTRDLLFVLQVLVVVALALALASPYVSVERTQAASSTVVVVDGSASMATATGDGTRFAAAKRAARDAVSGSATVVATGPETRIVAEGADPSTARDRIASLSISHAPGDLRAAVSQAATRAGEDARVVVVSDFADETDWRAAVQAARAKGATVDLRQVDGGGTNNVGIVARDLGERQITVSVANTGDAVADRTVALGDQRREVSLRPGDVRRVSFDLPTGGGTVELSPGDSFPVDDVAPVAAPSDRTVDVLVLTNDADRRLVAALKAADAVSVTVRKPPASVAREYDAVVVGNVDPSAVLDGTASAVRETAAEGGGVAVVAQPGMGRIGLGDLVPVETGGVGRDPGIGKVATHRLTRNVEFPAPNAALRGSLTRGTSVVSYADGSPLVATAPHGDGRVLYYGYLRNASTFRHAYRYPVFWKRASYYLTDRPRVDELNPRTGSHLSFANETTVAGPAGTTTGRTHVLSRVGVYETGDRRYATTLANRRESNVTAPAIDDARDAAGSGPSQSRQVPFDLSPFVAIVAGLLVVIELAYLRSRGDL